MTSFLDLKGLSHEMEMGKSGVTEFKKLWKPGFKCGIAKGEKKARIRSDIRILIPHSPPQKREKSAIHGSIKFTQ